VLRTRRGELRTARRYDEEDNFGIQSARLPRTEFRPRKLSFLDAKAAGQRAGHGEEIEQ